MSIESQLADLERRRDKVLREMDDSATHLGKYIKTQYSPVNVLRRHIGPAVGIAATLGTLAAGAKAPRAGILRLIWSRLINKGNHQSTSNSASNASGSVVPPSQTTAEDSGPSASHKPRQGGFRDVVEPIVSNIVLDVAQTIPWGSLLDRVRTKYKNRAPRPDDSASPPHDKAG